MPTVTRKKAMKRQEILFSNCDPSSIQTLRHGYSTTVEDAGSPIKAEEYDESPALDAGLLASAQAVEHYEICRYGILVTWASERGYNGAAKLLKEGLAEEEETDELLNDLPRVQSTPLQYRKPPSSRRNELQSTALGPRPASPIGGFSTPPAARSPSCWQAEPS